MYALAERLDPDSMRDVAGRVYREMAAAGYGTVGEFHYVHDEANALAVAAAEAAVEAGLRITLLPAAYARGGHPRFRDPDVDAFLARVDWLRAWAADRPGVEVGVAAHSVRAVPESWLREIAAYAASERLVRHVHASEQPRELEQCQAEHGCSPIELLQRTTFLSDTTTVVHAIHVSPRDVALLADARAIVASCPTTEGNLGDGVFPALAYRDAGVRLAIGSDSNVVVDPFEEVRELETGARREGRTRHALLAAYGDLWGELVRNGLASLGLSRGGGDRRRPRPSPSARRAARGPAARARHLRERRRGALVTRRLISSGSAFEAQIGYSRAVVDGDWVFVSGTTGFDYATMTIAPGVVEQAERCVANIEAALTRGRMLARGRGARALHAPARGRLRAVLARAAAGVRGGASGRHDARLRAVRPAHADRDRGHRATGRERHGARGCTGHMRRLTLVLLGCAIALTPSTAWAKEIAGVSVCAADGCQEVTDQQAWPLLADGGPGTNAPARPLEHFTVHVRVLAEEEETVEWSYLAVPSRGLMQAEDGSWMTMTPSTRKALLGLTQGRVPLDPGQMPPGKDLPAPRRRRGLLTGRDGGGAVRVRRRIAVAVAGRRGAGGARARADRLAPTWGRRSRAVAAVASEPLLELDSPALPRESRARDRGNVNGGWVGS